MQKEGEQFWKVNEEYTRLHRSFYLQNIFGATEFVKDLYQADSVSTQQIPNVSITNQDIVRVELHTQPLKGLSYRDLELAMIIDSFDTERYKLIPLETEKGYKRLVRGLKIEEEMKAMEAEIVASEGSKRFGNKFRTSDFRD
jgi:pterin-4a-carbinolamine dehydratase